MDIQVSLNTDADGFLSQECPTCAKRFKVVYGQGSDRPVSFCPYCGHEGQQCWWTPEQAAYFQGVVGDRVVTPMLDDFARNINRMGRPGDFLRMKAAVSHNPPAAAPAEPDGAMVLATFVCCGETIKHDGSVDHVHCVICGQVGATDSLMGGER